MPLLNPRSFSLHETYLRVSADDSFECAGLLASYANNILLTPGYDIFLKGLKFACLAPIISTGRGRKKINALELTTLT